MDNCDHNVKKIDLEAIYKRITLQEAAFFVSELVEGYHHMDCIIPLEMPNDVNPYKPLS